MAENPAQPSDQAAAHDYFYGLLRKRGIETLTCPACGAEEWQGFGDAGVNVLQGRDPTTGEVEGISGSVHVVLAACGRCGFIALFDREVIGE